MSLVRVSDIPISASRRRRAQLQATILLTSRPSLIRPNSISSSPRSSTHGDSAQQWLHRVRIFNHALPHTSNAGPAPYPNRWLVGFDRLLSIAPASSSSFSSTLTIPVPIGAISRVDSLGNGVLYLSQYELALNNERSAVLSFTLIGNATMLAKWPLDKRQISPYSVRA